MNATEQVQVVEIQTNELEQQDFELSLADMDLIGGGSPGAVFL